MKIPVAYLTSGMRILRPVYGSKGELFLNKGSVLTAKQILQLRKLGISAVHVYSGDIDDEHYREVLNDQIRLDTMRVFEEWCLNNSKKQNFSMIKDQIRSLIKELIEGDIPILGLTEISSTDIYTFAHSVDVCILALSTGVKLGYSKSKLLNLGIGALLHDLGKTKVPIEILNKPGKLDKNEFMEIKKHPVLGYKMILDEVDGEIPVESMNVILDHHEKFDGTGYIRGLKGNEISDFTYICAMSDVYSAISSDRVYRKAFPPNEAFEMIMGGGASVFKYELVGYFLDVIDPYPVGSLVRLNTGDIAIVQDRALINKFRPNVKIYGSESIVDLSKELSLTIKETVSPSELREIIQKGDKKISTILISNKVLM